jgi:hypothetical protein
LTLTCGSGDSFDFTIFARNSGVVS